MENRVDLKYNISVTAGSSQLSNLMLETGYSRGTSKGFERRN